MAGMTPADLKPFPLIEQVFNSRNPAPTLAGTPIATNADAYRYQIADVERALGVLVKRHGFPALIEQTSKLFAPSWRDWDCARTELLGLSTIESDGSLHSLGWPTGYGGNAPFDGVFRDVAGAGAPVAFDVKSAQGTGLFLVQEKLEKTAQDWARNNNLGDVQLVLAHKGGSLTQESVQSDIGKFVAKFRGALVNAMNLPALVQLVSSGGTTIDVTIEAYSGVVAHSGTGSVAARVRSILSVMKSHETSKAQVASKEGRPFLLVYVRPFGAGGSDLRPDETLDAARALDTAPGTSAWWLGTLFLDWTKGSLARFAYLRANGNYPTNSSPDSLRATLKC